MLQKKGIDEHKLCWFANLFSNFLILRALNVNMYQKYEFLFLFHQDYFVRFLLKYHFFAFICSLRLKLIYIHKNKVSSMFS